MRNSWPTNAKRWTWRRNPSGCSPDRHDHSRRERGIDREPDWKDVVQRRELCDRPPRHRKVALAGAPGDGNYLALRPRARRAPEILQAALLGIVQGLTEFLPVSSSAHLILARAFFGWDSDQFGLSFDVACHVGTLIAAVIYFRRELSAMVASLPRLFQPARDPELLP